MDISDAVRLRYTCRAFRSDPVPGDVVAALLAEAGRTPSGGNLQPWRVWALAGEPLEMLKSTIRSRLQQGEIGEIPTEYLMYPPTPKEPYESRKFVAGERLYEALGIARDDHVGRFTNIYRNFEFFGAPVGMLFALDRTMQPPQWAEVGMYLQTLMLLARGRGLDTAPIASWSLWHKTVKRLVGIPEDMILYAGMGLGHADEDAPVNHLAMPRAPLEDYAVLQGF